jgi:hypothetical protein
MAFEQRVPAKLVRAVIQAESNYQERARSPKGAMGLMQLMPETARHYAVADPAEPRSNIEGGVKCCGPSSTASSFRLPWPPTMPARLRCGASAASRIRKPQYVDRVLRNFHR